MTKKSALTLKELRDQLNALLEVYPDYADAQVWYRDADSRDHQLEEGLWDSSDLDGKKTVTLA